MFASKKILLLVLLLILLFVRFVLLPLNLRIKDADTVIIRKTAEYADLKKIISANNFTIESLNALRSKYRQFPAFVSFLAYIENQIDKAGLRKKINKLTQKENTIAGNFIIQTAGLQVSDLSLPELTSLLNLFNHTSYMIKSNTLEIKKDAFNNFQLSIDLSAFSEHLEK